MNWKNSVEILYGMGFSKCEIVKILSPRDEKDIKEYFAHLEKDVGEEPDYDWMSDVDTGR